MLVIISDIHLTDGQTGETIKHDAFRKLRQRVKDLAYDASFRSGDEAEWWKHYKPIEQVDVLLLGDILDIIRSPTWLKPKEEKTRPWSKTESPEFIAKVKAINAGILDNAENQKSFKELKKLKNELTLSADGRDRDKDPRPVKVNIHYMIGNHDWFYHLKGGAYDAIRQDVVDAMGLANDPSEPFPHDIYTEDTASARAIRKVLADHRVCARHGDVYDDFNYEGDRDASSLGDAIVVELLGRFPDEVEAQMGNRLPQDVIKSFRELDNVKPYAVIPGWINGLLERMVDEKKVQDEVKEIWDRVAKEFLKVPFVRQHDKPWRIDVVDKLGAALKISRGFSLGDIGDWALKYYQKSGTSLESYSGSVPKEAAFKDNTADFFVYGHTHDYEVVPLSTKGADGKFHRKLYINSGTWRRVHKLSRNDPDSLQFYDFDVMNYLTFFKDDERRGKRFECSAGSLGVTG